MKSGASKRRNGWTFLIFWELIDRLQTQIKQWSCINSYNNTIITQLQIHFHFRSCLSDTVSSAQQISGRPELPECSTGFPGSGRLHLSDLFGGRGAGGVGGGGGHMTPEEFPPPLLPSVPASLPSLFNGASLSLGDRARGRVRSRAQGETERCRIRPTGPLTSRRAPPPPPPPPRSRRRRSACPWAWTC